MELIKTEMTPKERALAYARGELVDRIPATLSAGETAPPLYGISIRDYYFSADAMVEVESRLAEDFQADNMGVGLGLRTLIEALGTELAYPENNVAYIVKPVLDELSDVNNMEIIDVSKDGRFPLIIEAFDRLMDKYGDVRTFGSGLAGPFTTAAGLIGTEKLLKATRKDPEGAHRLLQYATDCVVTCARDLHERLGIGFMLSEPMGSRNLLGKKQFNEFFLPYFRQAVERMNEFQGATSAHICGRTSDRWDEVVDAGICSFWIDDCESMLDLKERYGGKIKIVGNVPPVDVLKNGTPELLAADIRYRLAQAADSPLGFCLSPGCTTPVGTTKENMIAYMNAAATYGRGARLGCMPLGMSDQDIPAILAAGAPK